VRLTVAGADCRLEEVETESINTRIQTRQVIDDYGFSETRNGLISQPNHNNALAHASTARPLETAAKIRSGRDASLTTQLREQYNWEKCELKMY
jgi:hypothetical protein